MYCKKLKYFALCQNDVGGEYLCLVLNSFDINVVFGLFLFLMCFLHLLHIFGLI